METTISDLPSLPGNLSFLLGWAVILTLLNYLMWKFLHSHQGEERTSRPLWGRHVQPPVLPKILAKLWSVIRWVRSRARDLVAAPRARGITLRLLPSTEETVSQDGRHRIRQLLCEDPACTVCERVAREASQCTDAKGRAGSHGPVDLTPGLPGRRGPRSFPRSASAPAPTSGPLDLSPVRPASGSSSPSPPGIKTDQSLPFEERAALDWDERSHASSHHSVTGAFASSSGSFSASRFTWTKSSSGLSEFSIDSLTLRKSICQLQMALTEQEDSHGSSWTESKASSEHRTSRRQHHSPQKRPRSQLSLPRTTARSPVGASEDLAMEFATGNAPFLEDAVIAGLESHVLVKRVQHHLGLPLTLLRSLRSFMLPAPDLTPRRRQRELGVLTRPQGLPFVGSGTRKKLEVHLSRMVRMKRWQLPQRIQGALGQMKLPFQPREKKLPSAVRTLGPGVPRQAKGTRQLPKTPARLPTTAGVLESKTTQASQTELQAHLVKKSLEIRLEIFPTIVGHSRKMSCRSRILRLPKLIPLGQSCPQLRNRLCLVLRSRADTVDMNIKCKYIHFLWGLPTLYMQSLSQLAPRAPALPAPPVWVHATVEFVRTEPPFVEIWALEYHVLRKRLQHQWGLPGLILRSMRQFLTPVPSLPTQAASVLCGRLEVKISIGDALFLWAHLAMKEKLETHVKTKIIERRWGLPRRALDSLRVFIPVTPPRIKGPKENEKTFALPQGKKLTKRKTSTRAPRALKELMVASGKALQRHLAKKALEIQLGAIAPRAQRSQDAARRAGKKHTLPKAIPLGLKPLVPRSQELLFVDPSVLGNLHLNIIHKGLTYRWGQLTAYKKSVAQLFEDRGPPSLVSQSPRKSAESKFTALQTPFISRRSREAMEWHVRRKSLQHAWGLPGLVARSLRHLLPAAPCVGPRKRRHAEVAISPTEPTFLKKAVRQELERNMQKRIISQQWQLPKRVLESLRLIHPAWKADALSPKPPGFPFVQGRGRFSRKARPPNLSAPPITGALCTECSAREMGAAAPQRFQGFPAFGSTDKRQIELHWAKKCVEVQLEALPAVIRWSWKCTSLRAGQRLPKSFPPGRKPPQPRKCSLPLVSHEDAGRMEVAVRLAHLMSLWGLGARYAEGLRAMVPSAPAQSLGRRGTAALEFSEGQDLFLDGRAREALELHIRKKRLQHEWGLPVLIRSSIQAFVQGAPLSPASHKAPLHVHTLQQAPAFLPRGACARLEHHLQRLKLQRQWGLPLRVLKSLHSLMPEAEPHPTERMTMSLKRSRPAESSGRLRRRPWAEGDGESEPGGTEAPEARGTAPCPTCQGSTLRGAAAESLRQHLAKKTVEVHLEAFPAVPRLSVRHASLSSKQPLPKLIPPGHRVLAPRHASFPFLRTEEMDRVELALRCSRLASLWGLGARYVEAFVAMAPSLPFHPVKGRRAAFGLPGGKLQFFQGPDPAALEMHVRKKRMQHEWGLPALALRSLGGFMQEAPARPRLSKAVIDTYVVPQVLSFLPRATSNLLEFHVQRMKLQRTWGLPGRILASLKAFFPPASVGMSLHTLHYKEESYTEVGSSAGETRQALWAGKTSKRLSSGQKGMEDHLQRKYLETHLEAFPALVSQSRAAASGWEKTHLPKLVRAGQKHPAGRVVSPPFLLPATVDLLEVNVKHKHLAFLWGLQSQYLEPLAMLALRGHPTVRLDRGKIRFQEAKTPFCPEGTRERLEHHIQKKRLHHHWGLPSTVQRSLRALAPSQPTYAHPRQKISKGAKVLVADILFVSALVQKELETSLKKMIVQGRWGLPKRLQGYLHAFAPTPLAGRELQREEAATGGIMASTPDVKRTRRLTRSPRATSAGLVSRQAPLQTSVSPILGLFRSSKIRALETHLKRKSLEIQFQLPAVGVGTVQRACLPKCAPLCPVVKPRGAVLFVEPKALLKMTLNIKRKYLTYLWGLPNLHTKSLKKMFGTIPEWPQKKTLFGKEATWEGRGAARRGKWAGNPEGFGSRSLRSPRVKLSFLTDKASDLLESHVRRKKLQHEWGLPSTIQKSLRAFAPFPLGARGSTPSSEQPVMSPCCINVSVAPQNLLFLDPAQRRLLEEHVRSRTAEHRWAIPKRVQKSMKMFLPPASLSQKSKDQAQTLLCHCDPVPQAAARRPQSKADGLRGRVTIRGVSPRRVPKQEHGAQQRLHGAAGQPAELSPEEMRQDKTPRHGRKTPEKKSHPVAKFLTVQAWDLLEFHIRRKRIQHEWGLPSIVQKSLHAFAPLAPDSRARMKPRAGAYLTAKGPRAGGTAADLTPLSVAEVTVPFRAMMFLDPDVKSRLEAHVRSRTTSHKWGLPKLVQDSLRALLPPELHSQAHPSQSHQQRGTRSDSEGNQRFPSPELLRVKRRTPDKRENTQPGKQVVTPTPGKKVTAFISPEPKLSFLTEELLSVLEFHLQRKKVQHMWGLPSAVLKSLRGFAPFPFGTEKNTQHTRKAATERCPWDRGEVRVPTPSLLFLSPDTQLRLDAHLSNMVAKHRWGLPSRVQHSLKGFLPPRPSSPSQAQPLSAQPPNSFQGAEDHHEAFKQEAVPGRRRTGNRENTRQKKQVTAFSSLGGSLPFLTGEAQELLEFHLQRKKVQHMWGLPSAVLKSLRAFAPFPSEPEKHVQDAAETLTKRRPWDTEVRVPVRSLIFLGADTTEGLETHLRRRTAEHRWGLPKLVQKSLRALLPPASLSCSGETNRRPSLHLDPGSPQVPVVRPQTGTERSMRKLPGRRETSTEPGKKKMVATSSTASAVPPATSLVAELPFLTDGNRDSLEFHIQHKKIQHTWGLPLTVQKSVHAFAPVPPELHQGVPSTAGGSTAVAGAKDAVGEMGVGTKKPWITGTVNVAVPSIHFLGPDTKENLETHLRNLTIEHRWGLPTLVHKSMRAFIPLPSHLDVREMEDQEHPLAYSHGKTLMASDTQFPTEATEEDSSEDQYVDLSEPLPEMDGELTYSCPVTEEPLFCPGTKPEHVTAIPGESGSWKPERGSPQRSTLQKGPPLKKATQSQKSTVFDPKWDPRISSLSSSSPEPKKYGCSVSSWSTNLPRARYSSGRLPSGRGLLPRSSKTTLQNRKGMSWVERGCQRMAGGSYPPAGLRQPPAPDISYSGWELGGSRKGHAYPCVCYLRAHRDDSGSSLPPEAEQRWGKAKGREPDSSEHSDLQGSGFSSEESPRDWTQQEQESRSAHIKAEGTDATPQRNDPISKEAKSSLAQPPAVVHPHPLCKDKLAGPHRQEGGAGQEKTSGSLRKRGSRLGSNRQKKKAQQPHLPRHQPSLRALRRWSSKDLCEACCGPKPPPLPKGSENPTYEAASSAPDSRGPNQRQSPEPQNQGSSERKSGFQGPLGHNLQPATDDDVTDRNAEGGTVSPSKESRPLSTGVVSQFSTECEWERVGDWDTEDEDVRGRENRRKELAGSPRSAGEMPRVETSPKAPRSLKGAGSPVAKQSQASPKSAFPRKEGPALVKIEKRSVVGPDSAGRRMVVSEASIVQTVRVAGPEGRESRGAREEEEGILHWRKGLSRKGALPTPGKETLVRHGSKHLFATPRGSGRLEREALKMAQEISKGLREEGRHAQFVRSVPTKDTHRKLSLLGTIVEKKLFLQQGFRVWVRSREREQGSQKTAKSPRVSRPLTFQAARAAQMRWVEMQCCDSQGVAEPRGAGRALPTGPQQRQAGKIGSPTLPGYSRRASHRRKKEMTRGRSRSRERRK